MPHTEQRRRVSSGVTAHTAHHAHTRGHGHGLKRSASNVSTAALAPTGGGGNGGTGTAAMRGLSTMTGVRPPAQRQNSGKTDDGASSGNGTAATGKPHHHKSSLSLSRRKTSGQGDERRAHFRSARSDTNLTRLEGLTPGQPERPANAKHSSDSKCLETQTKADPSATTTVVNGEQGAASDESDEWGSDHSGSPQQMTATTTTSTTTTAAAPEKKSQGQNVQQGYASDSEETTDDDDDAEEVEHLTIKPKNSKPALNTKSSAAATHHSTATTSRRAGGRASTDTAVAPTANTALARSRSRSRSQSRAAPSTSGRRRRSNQRRSFEDGANKPPGSGVFARTKSQIGFEITEPNVVNEVVVEDQEAEASHGDPHKDQQHRPRSESEVVRLKGMKAYRMTPTSPRQREARGSGNSTTTTGAAVPPSTRSSGKSNRSESAGTPGSPFDTEEKEEYPFPSLQQPSAHDKQQQQQPSKPHDETESPGGGLLDPASHSQQEHSKPASDGSDDDHTLIGSVRSPNPPSTPPSQQPTQPNTGEGAHTSTSENQSGRAQGSPKKPVAPIKQLQTRNSHSSLRSLASLRMTSAGGPPPHPLSSPSSAKTRSIRGRSGGVGGNQGSMMGRTVSNIAAPQLNKEQAQGSWSLSTSPTAVMGGIDGLPSSAQSSSQPQQQQQQQQRRGSATPHLDRTASSKSLREHFGLPPSTSRPAVSNSGEGSMDALRKASFSSVKGSNGPRSRHESLPRSASQGGPTSHWSPNNTTDTNTDHRLSAHSAVQAASKLPTTSSLSASAYGDQMPEHSQIGLVSRFLPPSSAGGFTKKHTHSAKEKEKQRQRGPIFPEIPFSSAHASLVKTLMEVGARPASQVHFTLNGPTTGSNTTTGGHGNRPTSSHRTVPQAVGGMANQLTRAASSLTSIPDEYAPLRLGRGSSTNNHYTSRQNKQQQQQQQPSSQSSSTQPLRKDDIIWGLTPFEMSMSRCLEQRKGAVQLSTGGPLEPLAS